jgi:hypothetical protein
MIQAIPQSPESFRSGIWARVIDPNRSDWTEEIARSVMSLELAPKDRERMKELAAKGRSGSLTPDDAVELAEYRDVCRVMELMHAKALVALRNTAK